MDLGHVGLVVADAHATRLAYEQAFGIADFIEYEFRPPRVLSYGRVIDDCHLRIALGTFENGVKLEILQVVTGDTALARFFNGRGAGLHHLNFYTEEFDRIKAEQIARGAAIVFEAEVEDERGYRRTMYVDNPALGAVVEYSERPRKRG